MATVRPLLLALPALLLAGCPKNVPQGSHTGKDGKSKGARQIKFEEPEEGAAKDSGEAVAKGIVTYPGGDRVDWRFFEVPTRADVTVSLKWRPPRPGLDLSMNLFDETMTVLDKAKPAKGSGRTKKTIKLKGVDPGKYYVQIYASERGDAGAYTLSVSWNEAKAELASAEESIPDPPRLPEVPPPPAAETPQAGTPPATQPTPPVETPPSTPPKKPVRAMISEMSTSGSDVLVILDRGKNAGLDVKWTGQILKGTSGDKPLTKQDVDLTIIKVFEDEATARVHKLSIDQIGENRRVLLKAPPAE